MRSGQRAARRAELWPGQAGRARGPQARVRILQASQYVAGDAHPARRWSRCYARPMGPHASRLLVLVLGVAPAACRGREPPSRSTDVASVPPATTCGPDRPLLRDGAPTGLCVVDAGGGPRRIAVVDCPSKAPRSAPCTVGPGACAGDADCPGRLAFCGAAPEVPSHACSCQVGCERDADCRQGELCSCFETATNPHGPTPLGRCVAATCKTDADCPGGACLDTPTSPLVGGSAHAFACTSDRDECRRDGDCSQGKSCVLGGGRRSCLVPTGAAGRPLRASGSTVVAAPRTRGDWS